MTPHTLTPPGTAARDTERQPVTAPRPGDASALDCLDHGTLRRTVDPGAASPGRYLAAGDEAGAPLIPLDRPVTHLGRGLIADVRLEHCSVSRHHALIVWRGGACWILDDRSLNGTFVAGAPVLERRLCDGDEVRVGQVALRYREVGE